MTLSGAAGGLVEATHEGFSYRSSGNPPMTSYTQGPGSVSPSPLFDEVFFLPLGGMLNIHDTPFLGSIGQP